MKKCSLLERESDHAGICKAHAQLQDHQILAEDSGQPLGIMVPLREIPFLNVRMRLDCISGQRRTAVRADTGRNFIRFPDIFGASRRALFPGLIAAGRYDPLDPFVLRPFLYRNRRSIRTWVCSSAAGQETSSIWIFSVTAVSVPLPSFVSKIRASVAMVMIK